MKIASLPFVSPSSPASPWLTPSNPDEALILRDWCREIVHGEIILCELIKFERPPNDDGMPNPIIQLTAISLGETLIVKGDDVPSRFVALGISKLLRNVHFGELQFKEPIEIDGQVCMILTY